MTERIGFALSNGQWVAGDVTDEQLDNIWRALHGQDGGFVRIDEVGGMEVAIRLDQIIAIRYSKEDDAVSKEVRHEMGME
jgi:hypothetical protein